MQTPATSTSTVLTSSTESESALRVPVSGRVLSLHLCSSAAEPMRTVETLRAMAGVGIDGDRYAYQTGTYSKKPNVDRQFTLIEAEALDALARDYRLTLRPDETRRNAVTRGASLNHLVGRTFKLGDVTLRGIRLCDPCGHLERLTGKDVFSGLVHRGGLRCEILVGGMIRAGDALRDT
jgi:MOSC domain-containing protein YiiM